MLKRIDHIGIAVKNLDEIKSLFERVFGLDPIFEEEVQDQKVKVAGFRVGESNLEFLEPSSEESPIAKYIEKRGEGIHHLAVAVNNIEAAMQKMKDEDVRLIDETPRIGAEGKKIAFAHPKSLHGILLELSQEIEE